MNNTDRFVFSIMGFVIFLILIIFGIKIYENESNLQANIRLHATTVSLQKQIATILKTHIMGEE